MSNQRRDSCTDRVRQTGPVFPPSDTIDASLTPERAATTTYFLERGRAALRGEAVDVIRPKPQPDKEFQRRSRPFPAAPPLC